MRPLRKGQAALFNPTYDIRGETRMWTAPSASVSVRSQKPSRGLIKA